MYHENRKIVKRSGLLDDAAVNETRVLKFILAKSNNRNQEWDFVNTVMGLRFPERRRVS
jgi:hypothetical protein